MKFRIADATRLVGPRRLSGGLVVLLWSGALATVSSDQEELGAEPPPAAVAGELGQAAVQEAFRLLRGRFLYRDELDFDRLNRLSLAGVLEGLGPGAGLVTDETAADAPEPGPLTMADLTGGAVYLRPGPAPDNGLEAVRGQLLEWDGRRQWVVLDLREPVAKGGRGPDLALEWLELFVDANEILFKRTHPEGGRPHLFVTAEPQAWSGGVIALVGVDTGMVGELIAAVLEQRGAILVGGRTGGRTVDYEEVPLAEGVRLRFATSEVLLADDRSLFGQGLQPRWVIEEDSQARRQRVASAGEVTEWFMERARPRMNERALAEGGQPEMDWRLARAAGEPVEWDQAPRHDPVLRAVLDALVAARAMAGPAR